MPKEETAEEVKKPSLAELKSQAEREFVEKYNALCDEYGMVITPSLSLKVTAKN